MRFLGLVYQFFYRCRRHYLMGLRLDNLVLLSLLLGAILALSQNAWELGGPLLVLSLTTLIFIIHSRRNGYVIFQENSEVLPPSSLPEYKPNQELPLGASGYFAIRDQIRYLADHQAILTTPPSREHILMTKLEASRYLLLGKSPTCDWGWWYQFIPAAAIDAVLIGTVVHGWRCQPALRLSFRVQSGQDEEEERVETILSFANQDLLLLAWANLTREMRGHPTTG